MKFSFSNSYSSPFKTNVIRLLLSEEMFSCHTVSSNFVSPSFESKTSSSFVDFKCSSSMSDRLLLFLNSDSNFKSWSTFSEVFPFCSSSFILKWFFLVSSDLKALKKFYSEMANEKRISVICKWWFYHFVRANRDYPIQLIPRDAHELKL
jgi:hypothetical protein